MRRPLSIGIATAGRFHVLDLARELHGLGHRVRFYSHVPRSRAERFGLPRECHVSLLPALAPFVAWQRLAPHFAAGWREAATYRLLNHSVSRSLRPCDVLIAMSGMYLEALHDARARFGAKIVLVRGSKHIEAQDEILAHLPGAERPSALSIERELAGYEMADMIAVPSQHAARSFERDPAARAKVRINPYGVDLDAFPLTARPEVSRPIKLVFAGLWCLRKGCDLLQRAVTADPRFTLIHVGSVGDYPFPHGDQRFVHIPKVDQSELPRIYATADAFIQPSREEGLSNVMTQAIATGLPLLCTDATGGEDLRHNPVLEGRIDVVRADDVDALRGGLDRLAARLKSEGDLPALDEASRNALSWGAFAKRYERNLYRLLDGETANPASREDAAA